MVSGLGKKGDLTLRFDIEERMSVATPELKGARVERDFFLRVKICTSKTKTLKLIELIYKIHGVDFSIN